MPEADGELELPLVSDDDFSDLVAGALSSQSFWDNVWDDEDWNNV